MLDPDPGYPTSTKLLHWMLALLMIGNLVLGWYMVGLTYFDRWYNDALSLHKSAGLLILWLVIPGIFWLKTHRPPALASLKPWEKKLARLTHSLLLSLMVVVPLTGYGISTGTGNPVDFFGLFPVPAILPSAPWLQQGAEVLHYYLAYGGAALIVLHISAALKHHFIDRDNTLKRML